MNKLFLFWLLFSLTALSQSKFTVYFDTDSYQLNQEELVKLDAFLNEKSMKITKVIGYCDSRASNSHNDSLSLNRANFVKNVIEKLTNQKDFLVEGKGENFKQDVDLAKNRKVEIYYKEVLSEMTTEISEGKKGDKIILKNMNFYNHSGSILPKSLPVLEELLEILSNNPKLKIEIQGHICCQTIEQAEKIEDIALVRAYAIYTHLIESGISKDRLRYKSFKSSKPIYAIPENNEEERDANRRVEIEIIEN
ncbi:OmpA family protein [Flavobacterium sp.]|uniref:OmpA family protein n=1 Tax=Flavobacterium sp. TaxID=239 RepID=UPI003F696377